MLRHCDISWISLLVFLTLYDSHKMLRFIFSVKIMRFLSAANLLGALRVNNEII